MTPELLFSLERALGGPIRLMAPLGPRGRTFEIEHANTRCVAKRFETAEAAHTEAAILQHLQNRGRALFEVPPVLGVYTLGGSTVLVTTKLPGELRHWRALDAAAWRALGASLGALHAALIDLSHPLASQQARLQNTSAQQQLDRLDAQAQALTSKPRNSERVALEAYVEDCGALVRKFHSSVTEDRGPTSCEQPIHNDFNQYNYRFRARAPLLVTDWERAIRARPAFEVARVLNHVPLVAPGHAVALIEGYAEIAPLSPAALRSGSRLYLLELATKFWPLEGWPNGQAQLAEHALANARMVRAIRRDLSALLSFYEEVLDG